jgi:hypothetical protein
VTLVTMINSVGEHVAGEEVDLDSETADRYIVLGYAEGTVSGDWSAEEIAALKAQHQEVGLG